MVLIRAFIVFILAGLAEIGGGYLVWLWLREGKSIWLGLLGAAALVMYGVIATLQPAGFGRTYAAYGGIFIVLALIWSWKVDKVVPDRFDISGGILALLGAAIIFAAPRNS